MVDSAWRSAAPKTTTRSGWPGSATRLRLAVTSSGASDAQPCHPGDDVDGGRLGPAQLETRGARLGDRGEHKGGDHTELPPTGAPQRPEQLRFPVEVAVDDTPVGEHDLGAQQGIAGQPVESSQEAQPAAEGEAGDPGHSRPARCGGIGAARRRPVPGGHLRRSSRARQGGR